MSHVLPKARGLRMLFNLASDQVWFALAVAAGLIAAAELTELILLMNAPAYVPLGM